MNEIKSRKEILNKISEIRQYSVRLGELEDVLKHEGWLDEEIKDVIEKSCWKVIKELNKLTSEIKDCGKK